MDATHASDEDLDRLALPLPRRNFKLGWLGFTIKLLPLWDFSNLILAGAITTLFFSATKGQLDLAPAFWNEHGIPVLVASLLGASFFHVHAIVTTPCHNSLPALVRGFSLRFLIFIGLLMALGFASRSLDVLPRGWVVTGLAVAYLLMLSARIALLGRPSATTIAVVGVGPVADRLIHHLRGQGKQGIKFVGLFDDRQSHVKDSTCIPNGSVQDLIELARRFRVDWALITLPSTAESRLASLSHRLQTAPLAVGLCPQNIGMRVPYATVDYVGSDLPVSLLADRPIKCWDAVIKRAEDLVLGGLITLALSPLMLAIVLAIKCDSRGPALFRQRRHAWNNCEFDVYKFRTMAWAASPATSAPLRQTARDDPRITRVGRLLRRSSLDELPQLFNVLKGQMSLVGPRPHAVNMRTEARLGSEIIATYAHRHRVRPGITGWAQVNGFRGATQTVDQLRQRVEFDLQYIDHWSLGLDLKILVMTGWVVFRGTNAY